MKIRSFRLLPWLAIIAFAGCAVQPLELPVPLDIPELGKNTPQIQDDNTSDNPKPLRTDNTPYVPAISGKKSSLGSSGNKEITEEKATIELNFDQLPLPVFAQVIFGEILKVNVQIDQKVKERKDLVTLRSGMPQTPTQVQQTATMLLKSYGIAVVDVGGLVRVMPDGGELGYLPEIRRGSALPDTPLPLRPQFQLIELQAIRTADVASWVRTMFGNRINLQEDTMRNAILISGMPDNVAAALEAIQVLDQPIMQGRRSLRITPSLWTADDMARRLTEVLLAEGYAVQPLNQPTGAQGIRYPIILLPVSAINSLLVFAARDDILEHVQEWVKTLDQPGERGIGRNFFTYQVKHKDAALLAVTLEQLMSGRSINTAATVSSPTGQPAAQPAQAKNTSGVVVDKSTNMLIFQGAPEDFTQIRSLLSSLDRPSREALIEVTVAEVALTDKMQLGVEWALRDLLSNGNSYTAGTLNGLSIGSSGFTYKLVDPLNQVKAMINALASNNRATILSSPRVMARNGESATIQVGQEVPIVTSQQSSLVGTAAAPATGVLQTIQYRNTGVILKVKPVIHSSDQIDLDIQQEVSAAQSTNTGVNNSPTFGTRKLETKLTLKNGATVMLGGLISTTSDDGNAGIPVLKDVPILGQLFRTDTQNRVKTELIVLITPYVVNDDYDARSVTQAFRNTLGSWANTALPPKTGALNKSAEENIPVRESIK